MRSLLWSNYQNWYIGITCDPQIRIAQHRRGKGTPAFYFNYWDAGTKACAAAIERHFHLLGMQDFHGVGGAKSSSKYVYIFKINTNVADVLGYMFGILK